MIWFTVASVAAVVCLVTCQEGAPPRDVVEIMHSEHHAPDQDGTHSTDFEAENGIKVHLSGSQGESGGANMAGVFSYPMEDGKLAEFSFVADENGYQPQSDLLPVAPAFPHPIPQFVLDQIAFAREVDEARARQGGDAKFDRGNTNTV